jgi:hypothetical protein
MNIDQNKCELNENNFSSPEMCSSGNNNNPNQRGITRHQSIFTHFASPDLSTKKFFQVKIMINLTIYKLAKFK